MHRDIFTPDCVTDRDLVITPSAPIENPARTICAGTDPEAMARGDGFAAEITRRFVADFEKPGDQMAHVSTFLVVGDTVYMTYYANTHDPHEDPRNQTARLSWAPVEDPEDKTWLDLQTTGDRVGDKQIDMVYDTILMQKDEGTLYVLWTARTGETTTVFTAPSLFPPRHWAPLGSTAFR